MRVLTKIKGQQIFKDSFWALLGSVVGKGLSLLGGIIVARLLTKEIYGEYGIIKNTLYYIAIFSTFGLGFTATRFIARYVNSAKEKVYSIVRITRYITFFTSGFIALLLLIFSKSIATFLDAPHLFQPLRIAAVAIIFNAIDAAQVGLMAGFGAFKESARNTVISGVANFITSLILTYFYGLIGSIVALVLSFAISCVLNRITINRLLQSYPHIKVDEVETFKQLISFSLPIALQEGLYSLTHWGNVVIFVKLAGYGELALSSAASQWQAIILFIPGVLRNVTLAHLSRNVHSASSHNNTVSTMLKINFGASFIPFIVIVFLSNFISSFYGESFGGLSVVLVLSVAIAIPNCLSNVYSQELISRADNWFLFWIRLSKDLLTLIIVSLLLYRFELPGAITLCLVTLIIQTLYLVLLHVHYKKGYYA